MEFNVDNFDKGNILEIRAVTTDKMFNAKNNNYKYSMLNRIITEENEWANATNKNIIDYRIFLGT